MRDLSSVRQNLANPAYLRFALPGVLIIVVSFILWGDGWWARVIQLVGLALVIWPYPQPLAPGRKDGS